MKKKTSLQELRYAVLINLPLVEGGEGGEVEPRLLGAEQADLGGRVAGQDPLV